MRTFQCTQCGAPLEWPQGARSVACRFCDAQNHVEPPVPVAPFRSGPYQPVVRPSGGGSAGVAVVAMIGVAVAIAGVVVSTIARRSPSSGHSPGVATAASPEPITKRSSGVDPEKISFFDAPADAQKLIVDELGKTLRVREVVIYKNYVSLTAQGGQNGDELDRHVIYADPSHRGFLKPSPVSFNGSKKSLDEVTFAFADINFDVMSTCIADAKKRFVGKVETVTHVYVERETRGKQLVVRVYLSDQRRSGFAEYTMTGKMIRVNGG